MDKLSAVRVVAFGTLIAGLWWFSATPLYAQINSQDPTCTAGQKSFLVRMRCIGNGVVGALKNLFSEKMGEEETTELAASSDANEVYVPREGLKLINTTSPEGAIWPRSISEDFITFTLSPQFENLAIEAVIVRNGVIGVSKYVDPLVRDYVARVALLEENEGDDGVDGEGASPPASPADSIRYSPKEFGPGTARTITIDLETLKTRSSALRNFDPETLERFFVYNEKGEDLGWGDLRMKASAQGQKIFEGVWSNLSRDAPAGRYSLDVVARKGGSLITVEDVLMVDVPESRCTLLHGNGDPKNLDITFLSDGFSDRKDFFEFLNNNLNPVNVSYFSVAGAYRDKMNLWAVEPYKNVGCRIEKTGSLLSPLFGIDAIQCDEDEARSIARACPVPDKTVVISTQEGGIAAGLTEPKWYVERVEKMLIDFVSFPFSILSLLRPEVQLSLVSQRVIRGDFIWLLKNYTDAGVLWHEMGHAFGGIIDYYLFGEECENFPSAMCDQDKFPYFSDQKLSRDKYFMVTEFNKDYCAGTVEASRPYPNPYNPTVATQSCRNDCQAKGLSGDCENYCKKLKVQVRAKYPADPNENTCYATFEVYNAAGQLVRTLVSEEPLSRERYAEFRLPNKNYVFEWDGKDFLGNAVASGAYVLKTGMHNLLTRDSQGGDELKIVLIK